MKTLKRVCSLKTKQLRWTYDGKVLLKTYEVATIGRQNKLQQLQFFLSFYFLEIVQFFSVVFISYIRFFESAKNLSTFFSCYILSSIHNDSHHVFC